MPTYTSGDHCAPSSPCDGQHPPAPSTNDFASSSEAIPLGLSSDPSTSLEKTQDGLTPDPLGMVGRYELLEELAHGGMGVVYRARDTERGGLVALKRIRAGYLASSEELARFDVEARAAAQLSHPHIIPIYDVGHHEGQPYFTMKLVEGGNLTQHKERLFANPRAAVELMTKVSRAVQTAHDAGILHRDLKPANVLLDEQGEPLVADFGLAKFLEASVELTHTGQLVGTPAYMAPEQAAGRSNDVSPRTDVWSLGVMLYELLTKSRPFTARDRQQLIGQILTEDPPTPSSLRPRMDRSLEAVVLKCLEKEPTRRYGSARELAEDMERWQGGKKTIARPVSRLKRMAAAVRRHSAVVVALLLGMTLAVAGVVAWQRGKETAPEPPLPEAELMTLRKDEAIQKIQRAVADKDPVWLLGKTGMPAWSAFSLTDGPVLRIKSRREGVLELNAWKGLCLLELLPDPGMARYRVEVEVRHEVPTARGGDVGFYLGHSIHPTDKKVAHCFVLQSFDDGLNEAERHKLEGRVGNRAKLRLITAVRDLKDPGARVEFGQIGLGGSPEFVPAGVARGLPPWRRLALEVTPEQISAFWGDQAMGVVHRTTGEKRLGQAAQMANRLSPDPTKVRPEFGPHGAIGVYANQAGALFRSMKIEPLPE